MALFTDTFDGADNTTFSGRTGWSLTPGFYDVLKLDGSGAVKSDSYTDDPKSLINDTGGLDHYVEAVVGAAFVGTTAFGKVNLGASQTGRTAKFNASYNGSTGQLRIIGRRDGADQTMGTVTTTLAAGDTLRIEQNNTALTLVVKINGTAVFTDSGTSFYNDTPSNGVGLVLDFNGNAALTDIIRNFESNTLGGGDTTAPTLTLPTLAATSPTTLDAGFTSDEAGFSWTVLTPAAQAAPSEAQIRAGQDATGSAAVASSLNTAMIVGVNTRSLTGATAGTPYKAHTISQDAAGTPNVSNIVSSASETTPVPPQKVIVTLYQADGTTPAASITGLQWAWWDDATPDLSLAADISGTGASTDASGVFDVTLTGTVLTLGQTGTLLIYKTDGIAESTATLAFFGPLATVN